jgi:hypothetical protein
MTIEGQGETPPAVPEAFLLRFGSCRPDGVSSR